MITCKQNGTELSFCEKSRNYRITHDGFSWVSQGRRPYIIIRHKAGKKYLYTYRNFGSAGVKRFHKTGNCITAEYSGFRAFGKKLSFKLICTACITQDGTVTFSLKTENESSMDIHAVYFPAPFNAEKPCKKSYAVDTMRQGFLMPDGYKKNFLSTFAFAHYLRQINTGDCYLPFWGRVCDGNGFCAIVETPYDASMFSCFGKHGSFLNSVHWRSSLGKLSYERKIRFIFHKDCDYNLLAKDYRQYLIDSNQLVTIDQKIAANGAIKNIIGNPVLHSCTFSNIHPVSKFYKKKGENQELYASFEERAKQYAQLKSKGLERLYIHTDGWGEMGYDNNHPYVLPPCPQAGGYAGLKKLSQVCREQGYVFAIHDQYRDFYHSCKKFDQEKAVTKINGTHPYCDIWAGGPHTWLCASQALDYVKDTYSTLEKNGVDIQGSYLDVFSIVAGDECFHPGHPITREQSIQYRAQCFDYLTQKGIIPSSEEPGGLLINQIALVHHAPYTLRPQERGEAVGISVPLFGLVYHDCVMIPWVSKGVGGWGIPNGDSAMLHCILNSGMPYFEPYEDGNRVLLPEKKLSEEISRVNKLTEIQASLYNQEMVSHKFLDTSCQRQQATYADGTKIMVDFSRGTYEIRR